ncbi:MAG TPA: DNA polymerase I [Desulfomonilaceae bacterium]|nr:DNA polymerase I [Desulfomonilaceae bacterium]
MAKKTEELYLIDGSSYIHRAYHATGGLSNSKGFPTGAVFGFTNMIVKTLKDKAPRRIALVLDAKGKNFRHDKYPAYKANRPPMSEDLRVQLPYIHRIVSGYGLTSLSVEGYEADDIIATLAKRALQKGWSSVIVSGDKDLMQLVGEGITMWDPQRDVTYDPAMVKNKFGVAPDKLLELFALIGDSSDNVPGVPGVGPKTGAALIEEYGTLEGVYANADKITKKKLKENIVEHRHSAFLSRELVTLDEDVPVESTVDELVLGQQQTETLREIFKELEFKRLLEDLPATKTLDFAGYCVITTMEELHSLAEKLKHAGRFAVDTETTSEHPTAADLVGISLCAGDEKACYIPVGHVYGMQLAKEPVLDVLRPILEDETIAKIGQNIKYDMIVMKKEGVDIRGIECDTMLASYLLDPSRRGHSLDDLSEIWLEHRMIPIKELIGKGKAQILFSEVDIANAYEYACEDAEVTYRVASLLCPRLEQAGLTELFKRVELPLIPVLVDMEIAGVRVDTSYLKQLSQEFANTLETTEAEIHNLAGAVFNINSPRQLGEILFKQLGLKSAKKTKSGFSTSLEVLEELALEHELPRKILEFRSVFKLKSTYADALMSLVNPRTGRIHTSYNQAVAATGRLSSSDPNLQNIPIRTEEGRKIRKAFVPDAGYVFVAADYSQIELRVMAHISGDERLKEAFEAGEDIHAITAANIFECSPAQVTPDMRRKAKAINFGIMYGMGPFNLAGQIGVGLKMAKLYLDEYYRTYAGVKRYMEELPVRAATDGYVTTILGRKRPVPDLNNPNRIAQQAARRVAINTTIQGSAADIMKLAMIRVHDAIKKTALPGSLILQVHDELILEVREEAARDAVRLLKREMEGVYDLSVPLVVDTAIGNNWDEAH